MISYQKLITVHLLCSFLLSVVVVVVDGKSFISPRSSTEPKLKTNILGEHNIHGKSIINKASTRATAEAPVKTSSVRKVKTFLSKLNEKENFTPTSTTSESSERVEALQKSSLLPLKISTSTTSRRQLTETQYGELQATNLNHNGKYHDSSKTATDTKTTLEKEFIKSTNKSIVRNANDKQSGDNIIRKSSTKTKNNVVFKNNEDTTASAKQQQQQERDSRNITLSVQQQSQLQKEAKSDSLNNTTKTLPEQHQQHPQQELEKRDCCHHYYDHGHDLMEMHNNPHHEGSDFMEGPAHDEFHSVDEHGSRLDLGDEDLGGGLSHGVGGGGGGGHLGTGIGGNYGGDGGRELFLFYYFLF